MTEDFKGILNELDLLWQLGVTATKYTFSGETHSTSQWSNGLIN